MKSLLWSPLEPALQDLLKRLFIVSLAVHCLTAFFNIGFHHFDEHFQILEFAAYKLGLVSPETLPWEFAAQIRPAAQPAIVFILAKAMMAIGIYNPFICALIVRIMAAFVGWASGALLCLYALRWIQDEAAKRLLIWLTCFLWFLPYLHARFSSESLSGSFLFVGVVLVLIGNEIRNETNKKWHERTLYALVGGVMLGLSFVMRFQSAIAAGGLGLWFAFVLTKDTKHSLRQQLWYGGLIVVGFLMAVGVGTVLDRWFYGAWVFTPWRYFESNLLAGKAAEFGVEPLWWYFVNVALWMSLPPLGIILFLACGAVCVWHWRHPLVWVVVPFFAAHCFIGHKELRFLFPLVNALPVLITLAFERGNLTNRSIQSRFGASIASWSRKRWLWRLFWVQNTLFLVVMTIKPASGNAPVYEYLYNQAGKQSSASPLELYTFTHDPFNYIKLDVQFYRPSNFHATKLAAESELSALLRQHESVLLYCEGVAPSLNNVTCTPVASSFPVWVKYFNINNWMARTHILTIYECRLSADAAIP